MANYNGVTTTEDFFKTKNDKEVAGVFRDLGCEETYVDENKGVFVGSYDDNGIDFDETVVLRIRKTKEVKGAYDRMGYDLEDYIMQEGLEDLKEDEDEEFDEFFEEQPLIEYLQDMLLDDQAIIINSCGHEKLRYISACSTIITKNAVEYISLGNEIEKTLEKLGIK